MKRVKLDTATSAVKQFIRDLPLDSEGIELELDGQVVCEVLPPHAVSEAEQAALVARVRERAKLSRQRNTGVPAQVIEREIDQAIDEVRGRKKA